MQDEIGAPKANPLRALAAGLLGPPFVLFLKLVQALRFRGPRVAVEGRGVLIYCPNLGGHRLGYAARLIDFYLAAGCDVHVAYRGFLAYARNKKRYATRDCALLDAYAEHERVQLVRLADPLARPAEVLGEIVEIQTQREIAVTVFVDGDDLIGTFVRQALPWSKRLRGKNYAVFILSEFLYIGGAPWYRAIRKRYRDHFMRRLFVQYVFQQVDMLDGALYSDEQVIARMRSSKFIHVPEIGHARAPEAISAGRASFYSEAMQRYASFLEAHEGKEIILCFGDLEPRKGHDFLVRLCAERGDLAFVRVGRTKPSMSMPWESVYDKERLLHEGRLFELDCYIDSQEFIDQLFGSIDYLLLPYRGFYRTSSVMVQALSYGKPLLVADAGLMGARVKRHELGRTYAHGDYAAFAEEYARLREDHASYAPKITAYYEAAFSERAFAAAMEATLTTKGAIDAVDAMEER